MKLKLRILALFAVVCAFAACASVDKEPLAPVSFSGQASSAVKTPAAAIACAELAGLRCHMTKIASDGNTLTTLLDYPRCQIRFTSTFTVGKDLTYTIALKEIEMEGKGHNYTVAYINRVLTKWSREIQAEMLRCQLAQ